jgi:enoyl-CoA hydratase/carnithine racemase
VKISEAPHLLTKDEGAILIATLNRPEKLNALSRQTMSLFEAALQRFRDTATLKVMLIRAAGRYFCAGADLREEAGNPNIASLRITPRALVAASRCPCHAISASLPEARAMRFRRASSACCPRPMA